MSSAICQNFVQNAWKKELCSNCFKSKDEHVERPKPKPVSLISSDKIEGIIKSTKKRTKRNVSFTKELTEIIGYGGEDWESEEETCSNSSEEEMTVELDEDNDLKRITKENTDFNTTNLKEVEKKPTQLLLGKPVLDSEGRKQTLMVSVTPFGEETPKTKPNVLLTRKIEEKTLLEEITETLENGKNPIQIISRKKVVLKNCKEDKPKIQSFERKVGLTRTPALKRDQEKPVISTAKIELMNTKNSKLNKVVKIEVVQSREQAGEPDGRADPESVSEPPALPLTPPPVLETQNSFLHDKPKVPSKPATVLIRKPIVVAPPEVKNILTTFTAEEVKVKLTKQDSNGSDIGKKRRAPKPPEETIIEKIDLRRERASSCSPKLREILNENPVVPEPAPRKSLSVSIDNLVCDEKRKKGRFSLKKFLRMGSSKDLVKSLDSPREDFVDSPPLPKPRLVIVHPSELNGAKVEVLRNDYQNVVINYETRAQKPPPPPRNLEDSKPNLPHPPKSKDVLNKQKQYSNKSLSKETETVYANIGEVRSSIVPNKPQRTASMREREEKERKNYEENVYDYVNSGRSSSPDSDSSPKVKTTRLNKRSESSIDVSGDYFKYSNIPRSLSLTYCGSETESEIYSPYGFYGSESEVTEDDHDWIQNGRTHKLRSRKGRSIVHKNLEDNYGAVVVANHEALAQVLENIQQTTHIQPALRGLKSLPNLRWSDFSLKPTSQPLVVGSRTFHQALWGPQHVTLVVNTGAVPSSTLSLGTFSLNAVTEFTDLIPVEYVSNTKSPEQHIQANVAVLPWLQVSTIESYSESLTDNWKDASFVMLQFVNALKVLQAQGIEELSLSLNNFVLCKEMDKDSHLRLCVLQGLGEDMDKYGTLCMCASKALTLLHPAEKIKSLLQSLLNNERAVTLTQVKSILEFSLWGPSDVALGTTIRERELGLQRWLDLQRATVLHGLVCTRIQLTVYEECHLYFLVRSNSRMMSDASLLLESSNMKVK